MNSPQATLILGVVILLAVFGLIAPNGLTVSGWGVNPASAQGIAAIATVAALFFLYRTLVQVQKQTQNQEEELNTRIRGWMSIRDLDTYHRRWKYPSPLGDSGS